MRASPISRNRRLRSFSRQRRISRVTLAGTAAGTAVQSGSLVNTEASVSDNVSPPNARRPVSISNSTQPNAHTSVLRSTDCPRACSGLMYAAVPTTIPSWVRSVVSRDRPAPEAPPDSALARPKSRTFTAPLGVSLMLAGLRSRWMTALSCAASKASAICLAMTSASRTWKGPAAMRSASVGPSTSSSTNAGTPFESSSP